MRSVIRRYIKTLGAYLLLIRAVIKDLLNHGVSLAELSRQISRIGMNSLPIVVLTAVFSGMVLALQTAYGLHRFGAKNYVGNVVGLGIVRELGPVLTAVMLCGRVGAGIAAEIASMVVTEQVDAMRALGANPVRKLVTPRILAAMIVLPALVVFSDLVGIYGGALVTVYELGITVHSYYQSLLYTVVIRDMLDGLIKSCAFGFLLVSISSFMGLRARGGTEGVGFTTTAAVVTSSIVIFIANFFITKALIMLE
ncbi:MAG: ABC transporter permease [Oligoflexia bacterium]|nr:ABC transporter permease [Oligoflexia bacterium]